MERERLGLGLGVSENWNMHEDGERKERRGRTEKSEYGKTAGFLITITRVK